MADVPGLAGLAEAAVLFTRFYYFIGVDKPGKGLTYGDFVAAVLIRDIALVTLVVLVLMEALRPELDVVRADGTDDPAGGVVALRPPWTQRSDRGGGHTRTCPGRGRAGLNPPTPQLRRDLIDDRRTDHSTGHPETGDAATRCVGPRRPGSAVGQEHDAADADQAQRGHRAGVRERPHRRAQDLRLGAG